MKLRMILSLTIVCLLSAFLLSWVYKTTEPKIEKDKAGKLKIHLMETAFPDAFEYEVSTKDTTFWIAYDSLKKTIGKAKFEEIIPDTLWSVLDTLGEQIGIVFKVYPKGYGGPIETLVGLSMDTIITGIRPATPAEGLKETPGLGVKILEPWFKRQFIGKKEKEVLLKKDGGTLDAITASTKSSRAVANGAREGIERYKKYLRYQAIE
ncbi:FMN-binding protein [candidate division WOR-3 bacterium]|nr:FMN-binding protein [candidate division WOR-3 bacterium]